MYVYKISENINEGYNSLLYLLIYLTKSINLKRFHYLVTSYINTENFNYLFI